MLVSRLNLREPIRTLPAPWRYRDRPRGIPEYRPLPVPRYTPRKFEPRTIPAPKTAPRTYPRPFHRPGLDRVFTPENRLNPYPWRPAWADAQMSGIGELGELSGFFKKLGKSIKKAVKKVGKGVKKVTKKVATAVKKAAKSVGKFIKKNAKWIVAAAAIGLTIYTMGGAAAVVAKLKSGWASIKGVMTTVAKSAKSGIQKLLGGKKMGELTPEEAEGLANVNAETGQEIVPGEITRLLTEKAVNIGTQALVKNAMPLGDGVVMGDEAAMMADGGQELSIEEQRAAMQAAADREKEKNQMPSWVLPAAIGGGALVLVLLLRR